MGRLIRNKRRVADDGPGSGNSTSLNVAHTETLFRLTPPAEWAQPLVFGTATIALCAGSTFAFSPLGIAPAALVVCLAVIGFIELYQALGIYLKPCFLEFDRAARTFSGRLTAGTDAFLVAGALSEVEQIDLHVDEPLSASTLDSLDVLTTKGGALNALLNGTFKAISRGTVQIEADGSPASPATHALHCIKLRMHKAPPLLFTSLSGRKIDLEQTVSSLRDILQETA